VDEKLESQSDESHDEPNGSSLGSPETIRKSGLAYAAAISLFGSVVVMMLMGWLVDRYAESAPTGVVAGALIGSIMGFYQFFKINSKIFRE
jgi:F0F1-type ATP synthase assembly protein I